MTDDVLADRASYYDPHRDPENVRISQNSRFGSWDVVIRIDGHYSSRADAERMAEFWREQLTAHLSRDAEDS